MQALVVLMPSPASHQQSFFTSPAAQRVAGRRDACTKICLTRALLSQTQFSASLPIASRVWISELVSLFCSHARTHRNSVFFADKEVNARSNV